MDIEPQDHPAPDEPDEALGRLHAGCGCGDCDDEAWLDEDPYGFGEIEELDAIPPLRRPEDMPPVHSQADLHRHWRALMGRLGFAQTRLYLQFFTIEGRCTPLVLDITEIPDVPDDAMADALMRFCSQALEEVGEPGTRVGILYARPGGRHARTVDLTWARLITDAARRHGVPIFPVHVANDEELTVVSPDELIRPA